MDQSELGLAAIVQGFITTTSLKFDEKDDRSNASYDIVPERTHQDFQRGYRARKNHVKDRLHEYVDIDLPIIEDGGDW
ncbi:MAG TPA: hypothetical protein VN207_13600 [Ktedonobacteraceae bacterium]|nr:hypothetical protein [Ktedonobacteraceae bacterium]